MRAALWSAWLLAGCAARAPAQEAARAPEVAAPAPVDATAAPRLPWPVAVSAAACDDVLAALPKPTSPAEALAVGWCLRRGEPDRAAALLARVTGPLAPWASWQRAEALLAVGDAAGALAAVEGTDLPGRAGDRLSLLRGQALVALGRSPEARDGLRALLGGPLRDEALSALARGAADRGERDAAVDAWESVWSTSTTGPHHAAAVAALAALGAPVPDPDAPDRFDDRARRLVGARVNALRKAAQHEEALGWTLALQASGAAISDADLGRALFRARRYADAAEAWARASGPPDKASGPPWLLFHRALALSRIGAHDVAAVVYQRLRALHPDAPEADEAAWKVGYLLYDRGDCDAAVPAFADYLRQFPRGGFRDSARWFTGWCHHRAGRSDAARAAWEPLAEDGHPDLAAAAAYWLARGLANGLAHGLARGHGAAGGEAADGARAALEAVLQEHPDRGHAWFAAWRLGHVAPAPDVATMPPWPALPEAEMARAAEVDALLAAGFRTWAGDALGEIAGAMRAAGAQGRARLGLLWVEVGDARAARRVAGSCPSTATPTTDALTRALCWPRPASEVVDAVAARLGLDPLLPYAVMWTESAMDPEATSPAGARGLMQLMPAELPALSASLGLSEPAHPDDLYLPFANVRLGVTLLGRKAEALGDVLDGPDLPAVIAAYNGGEEAVRRWVGDDKPAPDVFAEDVGYTETRRYVRRVLGWLWQYRLAWGGAAAVEDAR